MRGCRLLLVWGLVLSWPALAFAEPRVVVGDFKGPNARKVRSVVVSVLEDQSIVLVPPKKVRRVARKSGAELDSESGRVRVANKLGLAAFVEGRTHSVHRRMAIVIRVFRGRDGMQAAEFKTTVRRWAVRKELQQKLWDAIGSAIEAGAQAVEEPQRPAREPEIASTPAQRSSSAAAQPEPSLDELDDELPPGMAPPLGSEQTRDDESDALALAAQAEQEEPSAEHPSAFDLSVGARIGTRSFGYNDSLPGLRGYSLLPSPSLALHGHWYPAAHFSGGAAAHIGLDLRADVLVGVSSQNKDGQKFSTSSHRLGLGLRGRIPLNLLELGIVAGYGQHSFSLSDNGSVDPDVPDINYSFVRVGADARYQLMPAFAVQLQAAFLVGLSLGEISSAAWFPHASGNGVEAEVGFQLAVSRMLAFELAVSMQRYFMSLNPETDDPGVRGATARVAGGALDKYFSSRLGLVIRP